jgi:subtilisin-like proprotein convertase family protein
MISDQHSANKRVRLEFGGDESIPRSSTVPLKPNFEVEPEAIEVHVEIRHTWRGGLRVSDTPPGGNSIILADSLGHWVAFGLVAVYQSRLFRAWGPLVWS